MTRCGSFKARRQILGPEPQELPGLPGAGEARAGAAVARAAAEVPPEEATVREPPRRPRRELGRSTKH